MVTLLEKFVNTLVSEFDEGVYQKMASVITVKKKILIDLIY